MDRLDKVRVNTDKEIISKRCIHCGKRISGYGNNHVDYLMLQHQLVHRSTIEEVKVETNLNSLHTQDNKKDEVKI